MRFLHFKSYIYIVAVDFQKAFDSIDRGKLIETLMKYRVDSKMIEIIADIYIDDKTELHLNGKKHAEIEVTSGIRQGCNGSTILFPRLHYFVILEKLQNEGIGYSSDSQPGFRSTSPGVP